ncbi:MAG: DUF2516 family protein [Pseudonocardia sp.]
MSLLYALDDYVILGIYLVAAPFGVYAFVHALMQRSDAFTAADKLTKPAWLGITGAGAAILVLSLITYNPAAGGIGLGIFWLAAIIAVCVYIVDVKPAVVGVQGGGQRW